MEVVRRKKKKKWKEGENGVCLNTGEEGTEREGDRAESERERKA